MPQIVIRNNSVRSGDAQLLLFSVACTKMICLKESSEGWYLGPHHKSQYLMCAKRRHFGNKQCSNTPEYQKKNPIYIRLLLYINHCSAFNPIISSTPDKLIAELKDSVLNTYLCNCNPSGENPWPHHIHTVSEHSPLSALLYSLFTCDCVAKHNSIMFKFGDETAYRDEVRVLGKSGTTIATSASTSVKWRRTLQTRGSRFTPTIWWYPPQIINK